MERSTEKAKHLVFTYGTLKKGYGNHYILENSEFVQKATTKPIYRLFDCGSYPCMVKDENGYVVHGEIYRVDDATLKRLDRLEGVPFLYQREKIDLDGYDQPVEAYYFQSSTSRMLDCGGDWKPRARTRMMEY